MKRSRILAFLLVLVFLVTPLAACSDSDDGTNLSFADAYVQNPTYPALYKNTAKNYTKSNDVAILNSLSSIMTTGSSFSSNSTLITFSTSDNGVIKHYVYNSDLDRIVYEVEKLANTTISVSTTSYDYFLVKITTGGIDVPETFLYTADGTLVTSARENIYLSAELNGLFTFGKQLIYRAGENTYRKICDMPVLFGDDVEDMLLTTNYIIQFDTTTNSVVFYDHSLNIKASYRAPSYAEKFDIFLLNNETLLMQYLLEEASDATEYDFLEDGDKYKLFHFIFNPTTGETTSFDIGKVLITATCNAISDPDYNKLFHAEKVPGFILLQKIEDRRLNSARVFSFVWNNDGTIGQALDNFIAGQESLLVPYTDSLYLAQLTNGYGLVDHTGTLRKTIKELPTSVYSFGYYFDNVIYSTTLEPIYTFTQHTKLVRRTDTGILFTDLDAEGRLVTYLYSENGLKTIVPGSAAATQTVVPYDHYFVVNDSETGSSTYYSMGGDVLLVLSSQLYYSVVAKGETSLLLRVMLNGSYVYKRFSV